MSAAPSLEAQTEALKQAGLGREVSKEIRGIEARLRRIDQRLAADPDANTGFDTPAPRSGESMLAEDARIARSTARRSVAQAPRTQRPRNLRASHPPNDCTFLAARTAAHPHVQPAPTSLVGMRRHVHVHVVPALPARPVDTPAPGVRPPGPPRQDNAPHERDPTKPGRPSRACAFVPEPGCPALTINATRCPSPPPARLASPSSRAGRRGWRHATAYPAPATTASASSAWPAGAGHRRSHHRREQRRNQQ